MAKTMGFLLIEINMSLVIIFAFDKPINTSAPFNASSSVLISVFFEENIFFSGERFDLLTFIKPLLSNIKIFFFFTPRDLYIFAHDIAAAPAPQITIFTSPIFLFANSRALISAAPEIIAVPC